MPAFDIVDLILFLGISQGMFLAISLRLIHNRNKAANKVLSFLLIIAVFMLFARMAAFRIPQEWVWRFGILLDTTIFLFGPFVYLYVRRLVFNETPAATLSWAHYIPAAVHLGYYFWTLHFSLTDFNQRYFSGELNLLFFIVEAAGIISFLFYWAKTFQLVKKYKISEKMTLSFHQTVRQYLIFFLATLALFGILWLVSFISLHLFRYATGHINYVTMWISTPLFIYAIGYFSLRQPAIFRVPYVPKTASENDRLKPEAIQTLQKRLHYFMDEEHLYQQPDITLKVLAEKLDTTPNNLSWLLNQVYQASFYEYINSYRIKAFLKKLDKNEHATKTFLALAMDVGFNSKSTFNRVFKSVTGSTPREYLKTKSVA